MQIEIAAPACAGAGSAGRISAEFRLFASTWEPGEASSYGRMIASPRHRDS
jgi:hypothetical protein